MSTELFDEDGTGGQTLNTPVFTERDGVTTLTTTTTVRYSWREVRDAVLASPMKEGVAAAYDRLEEVLASDAG